MSEMIKSILLIIAGYCLAKAVAEYKVYLAYKRLMQRIAEAEKELTVGDILKEEKEKE